MSKTVRELADALYDSFGKDEAVDTYTDSQIAKIMKKKFGTKEFKEYDELTNIQWREAWGIFNSIVSGKLKR